MGRTDNVVQSLVCNSAGMSEVARRIERAAQVDCPVFVWGEKGSGRKWIAEMIHSQSGRNWRPLATFSAEHSAATPFKKVLTEAAPGGTLIIDEVTSLPLTDQARLLDAAESRSSTDGTAPEDPEFGFRLMATSRFEPSECMKQGMLRDDLCYRLAVVTIHVPPLRERRDDIPLLVQHFLDELCEARQRPVPTLTPELTRRLVEHPWPGNACQLRECLDQVLAEQRDATLDVKHLTASLATIACNRGTPTQPQIDKLADMEQAATMRAIEVHRGNRTQAAKSLGISVRTLQRKLRKWQG